MIAGFAFATVALPSYPSAQEVAHSLPVAEPPLTVQIETSGSIIPRDTPVHLMVLNEVTTKTHPAGHRFALRVDRPVLIAQQVVIPVGTMAWGEVTSAHASGNVGKPGALTARLLYIDLAGEHVLISGDTIARGKGGGAETAIGVLALGPLGLFAKGNNAKIKAGERITAFTVADATVPSARTDAAASGAVTP